MAVRSVRGEKTPLVNTNDGKDAVFVGQSLIKEKDMAVMGGYVELEGEKFYRIGHYDQMKPFFMSLVSGGDHWLFISSRGGVTAGRVNPDRALFPYETVDKLTMHGETAGSKTLLLVERDGRTYLWEPFSERYGDVYGCERHLYKNVYGNKLIFEEINHDLGLVFRLAWRTGERFGFVKSSWLENRREACGVAVLDGLLNVLPYGATEALQTATSNLLNGYKRNELVAETGVGVFTLSATLTDQAEPSESLKATVAWQIGLDNVTHLLCGEQIDRFRHGGEIEQEEDVLGKAGAYLVGSRFGLDSGEVRPWHVVADVHQDAADLVALNHYLRETATEAVLADIEADIDLNTAALVNYVAAADGLQNTAAETTVTHHFANVMFNVMRGGIFANGYTVDVADLIEFAKVRNRPVLESHLAWFGGLPEQIDIEALYARAEESGSADVIRLCYEYLPLTFSRRHGDPSRPWNRFSINLKHDDGSPRLDYQGNWRDIFQNWEPLLVSFPAYLNGVIAKFLNATTADGYNPYRVMREGIEWEVPEPENPWANIGYWSDHQIIYLQKLLELSEQLAPGELQALWNRPIFAYADVPYRIRSYDEMLVDWYDTIDFDAAADKKIEHAVGEMGTDAKLMRDESGLVLHVNMMEKLLVLLLAKLTNLVPEGGIWMNTQRPEWNDANNALVGKGMSVVTTAYLRRFIAFWQSLLAGQEGASFEVNSAVGTLLAEVQAVFEQHQAALDGGIDDQRRRTIMDQLGAAATKYRGVIYKGVPETTHVITGEMVQAFLSVSQAYIEQTLKMNRRPDGMYHAYNILRLKDEQSAAVGHLYLMLEGQVAILSAGMLAADEVLALLKSMRESDLYRADQHSYMLYPNRALARFQDKNNIPAEALANSQLAKLLVAEGNVRLLTQDVAGGYHFNGTFRNANDVVRVLDQLGQESAFASAVAAERGMMLDLFEQTFEHHAFTGRSGTFFAYEGLGSIYWHMVSKLLLAVQECYLAAVAEGEDGETTAVLADAYYDIRAGIGFNKPPEVYGAFPTDPYSHTPFGGGAAQPGMTGQVKEELMTRLGELGVSLENGRIGFKPTMLHEEEYLTEADLFTYVRVDGEQVELPLEAGSLAFTLCQVPVVYVRGERPLVTVYYQDGREVTITGSELDEQMSAEIYGREQTIDRVVVVIGS